MGLQRPGRNAGAVAPDPGQKLRARYHRAAGEGKAGENRLFFLGEPQTGRCQRGRRQRRRAQRRVDAIEKLGQSERTG